MLQLKAAHIKLLIAICVIGHFQQIRMCSFAYCGRLF